ncbi:MAG: hypothetical protein WD225_05500, partial [Ilumatobacteraceae bacterium]
MAEPIVTPAVPTPGVPDDPDLDAGEVRLGASGGFGRRTGVLLALLGLVAGVGAVIVGTGVLTGHSAVVRAVLVLAGLVAVYAGLAVGARAVARRRVRIGLWLSIAWLVLLGLASLLAGVLPLSEARDVGASIDAPILQRPDLFSAHPLESDRNGLDLLGGVIYGARVSLTVGLGAVGIGVLVGGLVG